MGRSREVEIGIGGLYFLAGTAPRIVQLHLLGSSAAEVVVAFATASARPFTSLAFGMLVPVYGLGCCGPVGSPLRDVLAPIDLSALEWASRQRG